jgi:hypothetical protein
MTTLPSDPPATAGGTDRLGNACHRFSPVIPTQLVWLFVRWMQCQYRLR